MNKQSWPNKAVNPDVFFVRGAHYKYASFGGRLGAERMASIEHINELLTVAARLIDTASGEIRDASLEPVTENIEHMGRALASIFEVQYKIYVLRSEFTPEHLNEPSEYPEANRALTDAMSKATLFERSGNPEAAIAEYEEFLLQEWSELHRGIAVGEIERLRANGRP